MPSKMESSNIILYPQDNNNFISFINGLTSDSDDFAESAIQSSTKALEEWARNPSKGLILKKISEAISTKSNTLLDAAKVNINGTWLENDLSLCVQNFSYFSKLSNKVDASFTNLNPKGIICANVLADCPIFSFLSWVTAAPLAGGNSVVLLVKKPYSVVAICFAIILHEAGLPPGVLNVIPFVDKESLSSLSNNFSRIIGIVPEGIDLPDDFHFDNVLVKKHSLCPILIMKSADIDSAIDCIVNATHYKEVLWFPNVIYIEEPIYDKFKNSLKFAIKNCSILNDLKENSIPELESILERILNEKKNQGINIMELNHGFSKCFLLFNDNSAIETPVIFDENKSVYCHLISVLPIRTFQEAVSSVNSFSGGLSVSVWSNDAVEIMSLPFQLNFGTIWVNSINRYSPSAPFASWSSFGYGTFSGKRSFFENICITETSENKSTEEYYSSERNVVFSKKDLTVIIKQSLAAFVSWNKNHQASKANFIDSVVCLMENNWNAHFKIVLENTSEQTWKKCVNYLNFWTSCTVDCNYEQSLCDNGCRIITKTEPLGIIAIMAGKIPLDTLIFMIAAGIMHGNSVIVGMTIDEKCCITGIELENVFSAKPGLVNVIVDKENLLWKQFICDENVSALWYVKDFYKPSKKYIYKNIVGIEFHSNMETLAEFFEIYATKQKSVWLPSLF